MRRSRHLPGLVSMLLAAVLPVNGAGAQGYSAVDLPEQHLSSVPVSSAAPSPEDLELLVPPKESAYLLKGATVLTITQGTLAPGDVLIRDGRIAALGQDLEAPEDAVVLDLSGLYLTPGLIDAHSHSAVVGNVNESSKAVTAEVRIADILDPTDVNLYHQLAGGLTVANVLHGSANPIGGQNAVIKLRYGAASPDALLFAEAPPGIKFALGENVKQSNWAPDSKRYPKSRMGVMEVMRDAFARAREYKAKWTRYLERQRRGDRTALPPRRDLQLEALVEVLEGKRLVHCHSYRSDEILAMIRLAEELGFSVRSFQHGLEAYRVADEIAAHGAGVSCFTDWWAYKMEVYEAIPYNAALCWERGVIVSVNSDSSELARRMNLEAAKVVKYGGVPENEALKMVTLNPAWQLGIDEYVGSIEVGKHADLAVWSRHPLSSYAVCQMTFVDGIIRFDRTRDLAVRKLLEEEKRTLRELEKKAKEKAEKKEEEAEEEAEAEEAEEEAEPPETEPEEAEAEQAEAEEAEEEAELPETEPPETEPEEAEAEETEAEPPETEPEEAEAEQAEAEETEAETPETEAEEAEAEKTEGEPSAGELPSSPDAPSEASGDEVPSTPPREPSVDSIAGGRV